MLSAAFDNGAFCTTLTPRRLMKHSIAAASLLFGLQCTAALADDPLKLDLTMTCNAAAQFAVAGGTRKPA